VILSINATRLALIAALYLIVCHGVMAGETQCIVPAKPGGGMSVTCILVQKAMQASGKHHASAADFHISYIPGGIGAVAWNTILTQRSAEPDTLIAFSSGSLLNLAEGKYGNASPAEARWVAAIGADYGMIAVRANSPYRNLRDLVNDLKDRPRKVAVGASGTVGSQDWLKMSLIARQDGVAPKQIKFVAFEGGGEAFTALLAGHVEVVSGDVSEALPHLENGSIRLLAVLSDQRLPGKLAGIPTASEQGYKVSWPTIRGIYMGPQVSEEDYRKWVTTLDQALASPAYDQLRASYGLSSFSLSGDSLTEYIRKTVDNYAKQARELGLVR